MVLKWTQMNLESDKEERDVTLKKAMNMREKLDIYCLRKGMIDFHSQFSQLLAIEDDIMNFNTKTLMIRQSSYFNKPVNHSQ